MTEQSSVAVLENSPEELVENHPQPTVQARLDLPTSRNREQRSDHQNELIAIRLLHRHAEDDENDEVLEPVSTR
jgi:hypothetical protein